MFTQKPKTDIQFKSKLSDLQNGKHNIKKGSFVMQNYTKINHD